jgi:hypothetical protein
VRNLDGELKMSPDNHVLGTQSPHFHVDALTKEGGRVPVPISSSFYQVSALK